LLVAGALGGARLDAATSKARLPVPLRGMPLTQPSNLHLLVADNPPFVLDVDSGTITRIRAAAAPRHDVVSVLAVGGRAGVIVAGYPKARMYAVSTRDTRPVYLGTGRDVVPDGDGTTLWIRSFDRPGCHLRHVSLEGRRIGGIHQFACRATIYPGGKLGLVRSRTRVLDPGTARTVLRTRYGILAVAGKNVLLAGPGPKFTLLDVVSRRERTFLSPSILSGRGDALPDYAGRSIALEFGNPAWQLTGNQVIDVWSLDTSSGALTHVPGMPAFVDLKFTSMQWTGDGRLVWLAETDRRGVVAIWNPGARQLLMKRVSLPTRMGGSDSFAVLP
jgi:hypothetical protein